jgi:hypothetical protein
MTVLSTGSDFHLNLASSLLGLFFDPEDGGGTFVQNAARFYQRTQHYSPKEVLFILQKKVPIKIYFACILQGNQGSQLMICQVTCNYGLKTTLWSATLKVAHRITEQDTAVSSTAKP